MVRRLSFGMIACALLLTAGVKASVAAGRCADPPETLGNFQTDFAGTPAPEATFTVDDGEPARLADYAGAGVVLNFWATWCAPCIEEMPALDRLSAATDPDALRVLALSADRGGAAVVRRFYARKSLAALPVALDEKSRLAQEYAVRGLPTTILLDADGLEAGRVVGVAEWDHPDTVAFLKACIGGAG